GVFLPGLPTTIFWILAALAFLRVNRRMYQRIVSHPRFGAAIRLFVEEGRISRRGKVISIVAMFVGAGVSVALLPTLWVRLVVAVVVIAASVYVALIPSPPPAEPARSDRTAREA
ncbi:MAG TPA: YbaN family protein, partial [Spirochaetia bacterium]